MSQIENNFKDTALRDERFLTPRAQASSDCSSSFDTPRTSRDDISALTTARSFSSDGEYVTPRMPYPHGGMPTATSSYTYGVLDASRGIVQNNQNHGIRNAAWNYSSLQPHSHQIRNEHNPNPEQSFLYHQQIHGKSVNPQFPCNPSDYHEQYENYSGYEDENYSYYREESKASDVINYGYQSGARVYQQPNQFCSGIEQSAKKIEGVSSISPADSQQENIFSLARHNRLQAVESILSSEECIVNSFDSNGNTVLHVGCQNGNKKIVKLALRYGADISLCNYRGNTPLHFCFK